MKLYISSDMEGSTGVVSPAQVDPKSPLYTFGCGMQYHDTLAVVNAALRWGVEKVIVNDAHWTMTNFSAAGASFPDGVELISGTPKLLGMVEGANNADVAFFLGYHAMAGTEKAVLDHTYSFGTIYEMSVNGKKLGETGLNALFCGALGVPVAMVSGDQALCAEARSLLGSELVTCELKEGLGRTSALTLPSETTASLLGAACQDALEKAAASKSPKFLLDAPYTMDVSFHSTHQADFAALIPGCARIAGRTLRFETDDVFELRRFICTAMDVASQAPLD